MAKTEGKHRIAEVLPVGSDVSPELTRQYLADAVSTKHFSRLTDKILGRPPVKFVFSIVCDILKTTKYVLGTSSIMMLRFRLKPSPIVAEKLTLHCCAGTTRTSLKT